MPEPKRIILLRPNLAIPLNRRRFKRDVKYASTAMIINLPKAQTAYIIRHIRVLLVRDRINKKMEKITTAFIKRLRATSRRKLTIYRSRVNLFRLIIRMLIMFKRCWVLWIGRVFIKTTPRPAQCILSIRKVRIAATATNILQTTWISMICILVAIMICSGVISSGPTRIPLFLLVRKIHSTTAKTTS